MKKLSVAFLLKAGCFRLPIQCWRSEKIAGSSFQHCVGGGGEVRQETLYSRLTCAQKRQKCKFVSRILSMIADSRPYKLLSLWLVLRPPSASSSNGLALNLIWCSLGALMTLKSPKKWKIISAKVVVSKITYFTDHGKIENQFPEDGKKNRDSRITEKINCHSRFTQNKNAHSHVTKNWKKYTGLIIRTLKKRETTTTGLAYPANIPQTQLWQQVSQQLTNKDYYVTYLLQGSPYSLILVPCSLLYRVNWFFFLLL